MALEKPRPWSGNQWKFIEWMALPNSERHPHTHALFAQKMGINENTLTQWKKKDGFWDEVNSLTRKQIDRNLSGIYEALVREAKKGSHQHIKMALELAKHYTERKVLEGNDEKPIVIDDRREKIKGAIDELAQRRRAG